MTAQITGLNIVRNPKPNKSGFSVLAWFNVLANGIGLDGCALMHRNGMLCISPPLIIDDTHQKRIAIVDPDLRDEITGSILLAYRGLGGKVPGDAVPAGGVIPKQDQARPAAVPAIGDESDTEGLARFMTGAA
jgi:hypothetical protein